MDLHEPGTELGSRVRGGNSIKRKYYEILRKKNWESSEISISINTQSTKTKTQLLTITFINFVSFVAKTNSIYINI